METGTVKVIYLLFSIYEIFGQLNLQKSKALDTGNVPSTTSDKVSNVLRDILNQESLVRFSMTQKIQGLMLDVTDSKNDVEFLKKKLNEITNELKTLAVKNRHIEDENAKMHQELQTLYALGDHNNKTMDYLRKSDELTSTRLQIVEGDLKNFSLLLDDIRLSQNASAQLPSTLSKDCKALHDMGRTTSGVYSIYSWDDLHKKSVQVYCDMVTAGGGWTVIQNRVDGKVSFSRNWQEYKTGFGDLSTSYWIGNDIIHQLTKENSSSLYVSITGKNGTTFFIQYDTFSISGEDDHYRLYVAGKALGTLEDRIRYGTGGNNINGMKFSTFDKDNDQGGSCATSMGIGGWWFNACHDAYLNGQYPPGRWDDAWLPKFSTGSKISSTRMMIRRQ